MNSAKPLTAMLLLLAVFVGTASAQQFIIKKRRLAVIVEQTPFCPQGIAVAGDTLDGLKLCVDYPVGIVDHLEPFIGSTVEIEARWTFLADPSINSPVALGEVSMIGQETVDQANIDQERIGPEKIGRDQIGRENENDPQGSSDTATATGTAARPVPHNRPGMVFHWHRSYGQP